MAKDKAVDSAVLDAGLKAIADAIREKAGTEEALAFPEGMAAAIAGIQAGGITSGLEFLDGTPSKGRVKIYGDSLWQHMLYGCYRVTEIQFEKPESYTIIPEYAFRGCSGLSHDFMPPNIKEIQTNAYSTNGSYVVTIGITNWPSTLESILSSAFEGCVFTNALSFPSTLKTIGSAAFRSSNISISSIPDAVMSIDNQAFQACMNVTIKELPKGLSEVRGNVFGSCTGITELTVHSGITKLRYGSFSYCSNLEVVTFHGTPATIESGVFGSCPNLRTINVPWAEGAVANAPWGATNATINYNYTGEA